MSKHFSLNMDLNTSFPSHLLTNGTHPLFEDLYHQLYSIDHPDGPIPIVDPKTPSFDPEQARPITEAVFQRHGFHSLPEFEAPGRVGYGRVSNRNAIEYSVIRFPNDEFSPRKHITLPDLMPAADAEWICGVPTGLIEPDPIFSWVAVRKREGQPLVSSAQVVLPFFDPVTKLEGWQFAFPSVDDTGEITGSIRILTTEGETNVVPYPELDGPFDGQAPETPPTPLWAWVPVDLGHRLVYAFPHAPLRKGRPGVLGPISERPTSPILTPAGKERLAVGLPPNCLDFDLSVPDVPDGTYSIKLGPMILAQADVYCECVQSITPNDFALELGLWACHLARVTEVHLNLHETDTLPMPF